MQASFYFEGRFSNFFSPNKIALSNGACRTVGTQVKALGGKKVLIVTDKGMIGTGMVETVKECLLAEGIGVVIFDRVELETPARVIDEAAKFARDEECNAVVGFGGGTTLDTTKGVSLMAVNKGKVIDYAGFDLVPMKGLPKIMIPTTAGSGSEVTRVFAITDEMERTKKVVYTSYNLADVVILDPLLTVSLPPALTAETGLDVLAHAVEAYTSLNATPFSDMLALEAIRLVNKSLLSAYAKGADIEARFDMLLAATIAGLAWASGGLGAAHALSYTLETQFGMGHGRAVTVMLPYVMAYNKIANVTKYARIAETMGEEVEGISLHDKAERSVAAVTRLINRAGISIGLKDYGIGDKDLDNLVDGGLKQARLFVPNARNLSKEDVRGLFLKALEYK
jgi:alcohol dehydrogenase class IV